jgi:hypothetical protein
MVRLGVCLLVLGVILAVVGAAAWSLVELDLALWSGQRAWENPKVMQAAGMGCAVLGAGLVLVGVVRMISKRD